MRVSRRCPSLRRYFRPRLGFRTFIVTLAAVYFMAMYVFHSDLMGPPSRDNPPPVRRWEAVGADVDLSTRRRRQQPQRTRLPVDLQAAFDDIRHDDRQRQVEHEHDGRAEVVLAPPTGPATDANQPTSCNASDVERRGRGDDFTKLAGIYLLSAYWDRRPNDFDNLHNGTFIRLMAVVREGPRTQELACEFASGRTRVSFYEMCENHRRPYGSFIISCRVPDDVVEAPCFMTVVANSVTSVEVPVRTLRPQPVLTHSFTVCVPPLFGNVPPAKLVEFFEVTATRSSSSIIDGPGFPGPQALPTLLLFFFLGSLLSDFQSTKAFSFQNRPSLNFAHTLKTLFSAIAH